MFLHRHGKDNAMITLITHSITVITHSTPLSRCPHHAVPNLPDLETLTGPRRSLMVLNGSRNDERISRPSVLLYLHTKKQKKSSLL